MGCLGNLLWFIFGGAISGLSWCLAGCLWCITIVGIPVGMQCFKLASLSFFPFGKEVRYGGGAVSFLLNVIWLLVSGLPLALEHLALGLVLCVTVIGIPFGLQQFKLAKLALMPLGRRLSEEWETSAPPARLAGREDCKKRGLSNGIVRNRRSASVVYCE